MKIYKLKPTLKNYRAVCQVNQLARQEQMKALTGFFFMPIEKDTFLNGGCWIFVALNKLGIAGYSAWTQASVNNEHCIAFQLYVKPPFRKQGLGRRLISANVPNISAILADTVNRPSFLMYQKYFKHLVVYGRLQEYKWQPASSYDLFKQIYLIEKKAREQWDKWLNPIDLGKAYFG